MIYILLFAISLVLCFVVCLHFEMKQRSLIRLILEANNIFCIQYIFFSCFFIFGEIFAVWKPIVCILILDLLVLAVFKWNKLKRKQVVFFIQKEERILLLVLLASIPLIRVTAEDIGAASDQGGYFLHTILYVEEKSSEIHTIDEEGISEAVDEGLWELQEALTCYYHKEGEHYYSAFALGTWCSISALFGKMFGIWNCMKAVNYLYILAVCNMFYLCRKIAENEMGVYLGLGIFAFSPLILYIGKAGLTEAAMVLLGLMGINYILEDQKWFYILAGISVGLIGFLHVSIILYMPVITLIAAIKSINTEKKYYAVFNMIQMGMYAVSVWYAYAISPVYVEKQYSKFTLQGRIGYSALFAGIDVIVVGLILCQFWIYKEKKIFLLTKMQKFLRQYFKPIVFCIFVMILCRTIYYAYNLCFTDKFAIPNGYDAGSWNLRSNYANTGLYAISYLNIVNLARATGGIGFLAFFLIPFIKKDITEKNLTFYFMGLYGVFIHTVIQMDTPFNYYASRYFVPFTVPMMILTLVSFIEKRTWCMYVLLVALLFDRRYWFSFVEGGPRVGQYQILQDALNEIPERAVVFCDPDSQTINICLSSNLRIINDNKVYNLKNYDAVCDYYQEEDKYIISEYRLDRDDNIIWNDIYLSQYSFGNGKYGSYDTGVGRYEIPLYIYKIEY